VTKPNPVNQKPDNDREKWNEDQNDQNKPRKYQGQTILPHIDSPAPSEHRRALVSKTLATNLEKDCENLL
jgi:hypothetical protein